MATGKIAKSMLNVANDFYNGAAKGVPKAQTTVNRALSKAPKNLNRSASVKTIQNTAKVRSGIDNAKGLHLGAHSQKLNNARMIHKSPQANMATTSGNFFGGGIRDSIQNKKSGQGLKQAIKAGHSTNGQLDGMKIAGTAATVGVAGRVASGGGLYRDKYGNVNLPGIPFI